MRGSTLDDRSMTVGDQHLAGGSRLVTSSGAAPDQRQRSEPGDTPGTELGHALHRAAGAARHRLNAVSAGVYLLDERRGGLHLALADGSPPSLFTLPGRMELDGPAATVRAVLTGETAVLLDPDPADARRGHHLPYPYVAAAAPVVVGGRRFGALTVLRLETDGAFTTAERTELRGLADRLAVVLAGLADDGVAVAAGPMPVLVPPGRDDPRACVRVPGWGLDDIPGSPGTSMMFPLRRLAELLNRATTIEEVVQAARYCVMDPLRARALALVTALEGRLWVLGHSGASSGMARALHGARMDDRTPAAEAFRGRPVFLSGHARTGSFSADESRAELYLPLTGDRQFIDLALGDSGHVVAVCCLEFSGPRGFPPEERALLGMMAGLLGAAVRRIELSAQQRAMSECLQRFLLPSRLSDLPRLATAARYRPAGVTTRVGGDWYDVITLPGDRAVLVVGDVEGHSVESTAVMGQMRTAVASYAAEGHRPAAVIDRTARLLAALGTDLTATCCVVSLDTLDGTAEVALSGHPPPLVRRPDGSIGVLAAPANLPLGVPTADACQAREHRLECGSVLMLYTNGLVGWDAPDPQARLHALLDAGGGAPAPDLEQLADLVVEDGSTPQQRRDDAVLLLALYGGAAGQEEPRVGSLHIQRRDLLGVRAARTFVQDQLGDWGLEEMSEPLELVVSEIVTNALIHAGSDVDVRLRAFDDHLRLEVRDSDSNPPIPSSLSIGEEENAEAEHGRGLLIVEALADTWNSSPNGQGKTVSLTLPITGR
ncbi:SpoIIE family protein phosphatase [Streptomyces sp. NPDC052727]|uniref:SpoIIE family protein phosphatase n=1 Tax=Streptomyces sp. NPDC052727 TaxID=3154854 RepID=UPI0034324975